MNALLAHKWGLSASGDTLKRQIVIPDGDHELVLSTDWSETTISRVFRQNMRGSHKSVRALEVPPELVQTVRAFLQAKDALDGSLEHFNRLLLEDKVSPH